MNEDILFQCQRGHPFFFPFLTLKGREAVSKWLAYSNTILTLAFGIRPLWTQGIHLQYICGCKSKVQAESERALEGPIGWPGTLSMPPWGVLLGLGRPTLLPCLPSCVWSFVGHRQGEWYPWPGMSCLWETLKFSNLTSHLPGAKIDATRCFEICLRAELGPQPKYFEPCMVLYHTLVLFCAV
jgi:hypothetical protein